MSGFFRIQAMPHSSCADCESAFFAQKNKEVSILQKKQSYWFRFVRETEYAEEPPQKNAKLWSFIYDTVGSAAAAAVIIAIVFTFGLRLVGVVGSSMEPTLTNGDWLAVSSITPTIHTGDVVIVTQPNPLEKPLVKRVIAKGGDTVDIDFDSHIVTVNGKVLDEPYIAEPTALSGDVQFPLTVEQGQLFVMGDNRNNSMDSRYSVIGCVDEAYILGVAKYRVYPFGGLAKNTIQ